MDIFDDYHEDEWIKLTVYFNDGGNISWLGISCNFECVADKFIRIHNPHYFQRSLICIPFTSVAYCRTEISEKPSYGKNGVVYSDE